MTKLHTKTPSWHAPLRVVGLAIACVVLLAACGQSSNGDDGGNTPSPQTSDPDDRNVKVPGRSVDRTRPRTGRGGPTVSEAARPRLRARKDRRFIVARLSYSCASRDPSQSTSACSSSSLPLNFFRC